MSDIRKEAEELIGIAEDRCICNPTSPCRFENLACNVGEAFLKENDALSRIRDALVTYQRDRQLDPVAAAGEFAEFCEGVLAVESKTGD